MRQLKIDIGPRYWKYGVYQKGKLWGWKRLYASDNLDLCEDFIKRLLSLPRYFPEAPKQ